MVPFFLFQIAAASFKPSDHFLYKKSHSLRLTQFVTLSYFHFLIFFLFVVGPAYPKSQMLKRQSDALPLYFWLSRDHSCVITTPILTVFSTWFPLWCFYFHIVQSSVLYLLCVFKPHDRAHSPQCELLLTHQVIPSLSLTTPTVLPYRTPKSMLKFRGGLGSYRPPYLLVG